jgi:hypothetical protein
VHVSQCFIFHSLSSQALGLVRTQAFQATAFSTVAYATNHSIYSLTTIPENIVGRKFVAMLAVSLLLTLHTTTLSTVNVILLVARFV